MADEWTAAIRRLARLVRVSLDAEMWAHVGVVARHTYSLEAVLAGGGGDGKDSGGRLANVTLPFCALPAATLPTGLLRWPASLTRLDCTFVDIEWTADGVACHRPGLRSRNDMSPWALDVLAPSLRDLHLRHTGNISHTWPDVAALVASTRNVERICGLRVGTDDELDRVAATLGACARVRHLELWAPSVTTLLPLGRLAGSLTSLDVRSAAAAITAGPEAATRKTWPPLPLLVALDLHLVLNEQDEVAIFAIYPAASRPADSTSRQATWRSRQWFAASAAIECRRVTRFVKIRAHARFVCAAAEAVATNRVWGAHARTLSDSVSL